MHTTETFDSVNTEVSFPEIREGTIGGLIVQTVNARDLHAALRVGKDFSNWIKDRIAAYTFNENSDFVVFAGIGENPSGGRPAKEYALTLDTAKEIAMVERNDAGRIIRRHFIACERMLKEVIRREADIEAIVDRRVTDRLDAVLSRRNLMLRYGRTSGQIYSAAGFPALKGMAAWFGNRLREMDCSIANEGRSEQGGRTARVFDPDKATLWLEKSGGRLLVEQKIMQRRGQNVIRLVPPISEAARTY